MNTQNSKDFTELFLIKYVNTLFNGEFNLNLNFDEKIFEEFSLKQAFKTYLHCFLEEFDSKSLCVSCVKSLETQESRFFNFKTENFIKKLKDCFIEIKSFRENFFTIIEKFVAADLKITEISKENRLSLLHLEILKNNIEESNRKIVELKENILFLILHPAEKNEFFQLNGDFPYQEYKSKLKENLFQNSKFSFDFDRILSQLTQFKNSLLKTNSPVKNTILEKENKEEIEKIENTKTKEIKKYRTPTKERLINAQIFIDDTFLKQNIQEKPQEITEKPKKHINRAKNPSLSAKNADNKVILFMSNKDKWTHLNPNSDRKTNRKPLESNKKKPDFSNKKPNFSTKKPNKKEESHFSKNVDILKNTNILKNGHISKTGDNLKNEDFLKKGDIFLAKNCENADIFQERISEIQCITETSDCMTPVKLLRDLIISDFGSTFIQKNPEEEKILLRMSPKLKEKLKKDYNLDIDLIEKEAKNPPMQTPSFGANNGFKHVKNIEKNGKKIQEFCENGKKMEQINEVNSPKEEKFGHFEFVEKVFQPVLKKNKEKVKVLEKI